LTCKSDYYTFLDGIFSGLQGIHQHSNAAVAVEACRLWAKQFCKLNNLDMKTSPHSLEYSHAEIPTEFRSGLENATFYGRAQICHSEKYPGCEFYLDGAHTLESLQVSKGRPNLRLSQIL
jgi:folylpolyglutamate synthase/dihydropteroate synthase